ncbi:MAG: DUF2442 domain-containing protein [Alkalinema sp. RU_4_3]|nr:DUF2442 domain-containing protein [Alkalinema sp. RU_4_3]
MPTIISAQTIDDLTLVVEFSNGDRKQYDISRLLEKPMFSQLKSPGFFRSFQVEAGGYGIAWNDEIDLSEYELWQNGIDVVAVVEGDCASVVG